MNRPFTRLICAAFLLCAAAPVRAADNPENPPNASFGIAGSFCGYSAWERKKGESSMDYTLSPGYGGGLVFEKMFNNVIGIQSGVWFNRFTMSMKMKESFKWTSIDPMSFIAFKMTATGWSISVPLALVTSLNASFFSFNILAGIKYTHIVDTDIKLNNFLLTYKRHFDMLPYINQPQFGFTLGITFKFRVARFVDLFFGGAGELYVTEFVGDSDDIALLFDLAAIASVMFRTNIFPIPPAAPVQ